MFFKFTADQILFFIESRAQFLGFLGYDGTMIFSGIVLRLELTFYFVDGIFLEWLGMFHKLYGAPLLGLAKSIYNCNIIWKRMV